MTEIWKDVPGFGNHYMASSEGRLKAKERATSKRYRDGRIINQIYKERILTLHKTMAGYDFFPVTCGGVSKTVLVSRLVCLAFHGLPPSDSHECCHNDGDKNNNRPSNLRWDTHAANMADKEAHGTIARGEAHPSTKYSDEIVSQIRANKISRQHALKNLGMSVSQFHRLKRGVSRAWHWGIDS